MTERPTVSDALLRERAHAANNALLAARANLELARPFLAGSEGEAYLVRALEGIDRAARSLAGAPRSTAPSAEGPAGDDRLDRQPAESSAPDPQRAISGRAILVAEDDPAVRDLLVGLLGEDGARVRSAASADRALAVLREEAVDLVVLDRNLGGENPEALFAALDPGIRVLVVTGAADAPESAPGPARSWPVLAKPFRVEAFRRAVAAALAASRPPAVGPRADAT